MGLELFNLAPVAWLLLVAALLATVPLIWLARTTRHGGARERLAALSLLLVVLTFDLTVFGAFTRLTDSGLGCPDWPGCYATLSPVHAHADIQAAQTIAPDGPVTHKKAWIEMIHRYLASTVGALIMVQMLGLWWLRWKQSQTQAPLPFSPWWGVAAFIWVCLQGLFGALTVTMKLRPIIVSLHLLGAIGLLVLLQIQSSQWRLALGRVPALHLPPPVRLLGWGVLALLLLQIALGAWVSTNYAVLVCSTWPLCNGEWLPTADYASGFSLWRELGRNADGSYLSYHALLAIHLVHRWVAVPVVALCLYLAWHLRGAAPKIARNLSLLILLQFATGLSNVVLGWPLLAALLHNAGAAALILVLLDFLVQARVQPLAKTVAP